MALIEALIDFGEDENIEDDVYDNGEAIHGYISLMLKTCDRRGILTDPR